MGLSLCEWQWQGVFDGILPSNYPSPRIKYLLCNFWLIVFCSIVFSNFINLSHHHKKYVSFVSHRYTRETEWILFVQHFFERVILLRVCELFEELIKPDYFTLQIFKWWKSKDMFELFNWAFWKDISLFVDWFFLLPSSLHIYNHAVDLATLRS